MASLLEIPQSAVHDRAHAALAILAPRLARGLSAERRDEVGDYLLGQRSGVAARLATRTYLEGAPEARAWAEALSDELAPLAGASLPEIPTGTASSSVPREQEGRAAPPGAAPVATGRRARHSPTSSRTGGALLLAAIVAVVVVAVVLIANSGGGSTSSSSSDAASSSPGGSESSGSTGTSGTSAATSTTGSKAKEDHRITLRPPSSSSKAAGIAEVLSEGSQYAFYLAAEHLPPSKGKGFFYAVWLYNSPTSHEALGRSPEVGAKGSLQGGALLPKDAGTFHTMLLTRETSTRPSKPGPIVLSGSFALH